MNRFPLSNQNAEQLGITYAGMKLLGVVPSASVAPAPVVVPAVLQLAAPKPASPEKHMSFLSTVLSTAEKYFTGIYNAVLGSDEARQLETSIVGFVKTDVGKLAIDGVQYASTLVGKSDAELKAAAVAQLKVDLKAAGKDVESIGESALNLFIEMAYNYTAGVVAKLPEAIK